MHIKRVITIKMHIISFTKNKKGFMTLNQAIILFFAAVIFIGYKLESAISSESGGGSIANLRRLSVEIKELIESPDDEDYRIINYFIVKRNILLGWNTDATNVYSGIAVGDGSIMWSGAYKPSSCGNSACLCLYNGAPSGDFDERDNGVLECVREGMVGKNIDFSFTRIFETEGALTRKIEIGEIYIEKTKKADGTYTIYIEDSDASGVDTRKKDIDNSR